METVESNGTPAASAVNGMAPTGGWVWAAEASPARRTQRFERQLRPGSQLPPPVHSQRSVPTAQAGVELLHDGVSASDTDASKSRGIVVAMVILSDQLPNAAATQICK